MNSEIINASIDLELAVAELYLHFYRFFPEDSNFWWKMSLEEKGHAALLKSGRDSFMPLNKFPDELISDSLNDLKKSVKSIKEKLKEIKKNPISRREAFEMANEIEQTTGEIHYQEVMANTQDESLMSLFQKLNGDDKDHSKRILKYMNDNGIQQD